MADVVKKLTIRYTSEGLEKAQRDLDALKKSYDGVSESAQKTATVTETSSKSGLSTAAAYRRQTIALDEAARAQDRIAKATKVADGALSQGLITQTEHAQRLDLIKTKYSLAGAASGEFTNQSKLARYELINLSRQVQDVGVSLASGQSPFTVMIQQGSQIYDVFASSTGTVKGFFSQVSGAVSGFLTPLRQMAIGTTAIGTTAVYAAASWSSGQRDITRALSGIGEASGVTRAQINQIGEVSSSALGLSKSEAREAATGFAATGQIYFENTKRATDILKGFASAIGETVPDAQKKLTAALLDPAAGALELNKTMGFLTLSTLNYVRQLQNSGDLQGAQKALLDAMAPAAKKAAEQQSYIAKGWDAATNAASEYWDMIKQISAIGAQKLTGADFGGISDERNLQNAQKNLQEQISGPFQGPLNKASIQNAIAEVEKYEAKIKQAAEAAADKRFEQFALAADAATRALIQQIDHVDKLTAALAAMYKVQDRQRGTTGRSDPQLDNAIKSANLQSAIAIEAEDAEARRVNRVAEIALQYDKVGVSTAVALDRQKDQLAVASAFTGQERMIAQEKATYNQLLDQGKTSEEAAALAASQRAVTQAEINSQAKNTLYTLQDQAAVASAYNSTQRAIAESAATYNALIRASVNSLLAGAVAAQQLANAQAQIQVGAQKTLDAARDHYGVAVAQGAVAAANSGEEQRAAQIAQVRAEAVERRLQLEREENPLAKEIADQEERNKMAVLEGQQYAQRRAEAQQEYNDQLKEEEASVRRSNELRVTEYEQLVAMRREEEKMIAAWFAAHSALGGYAGFAVGGQSQFTGNNGKGGYDSTFPNKVVEAATSIYGEKGFDSRFDGPRNPGDAYERGTIITPNAIGWENVADKMLRSNKSGTEAIEFLTKQIKVLPGVGLLGAPGGTNVDAISGVIQKIIETLPDSQKASAIQLEIDKVKTLPISVARDTLIKSLTDSLDQLKDSTDALNNTIGLSDIYTTDPRLSHIGYRAGSSLDYDPFAQPTATRAPGAASGPTVTGAEPYLGPLSGFASGGSFTVPGGYSANDNMMARFPVASGELVTVQTPAQQKADGGKASVQNITINVPITVNGGGDENKVRMSAFQGVQRAANQFAALRR